MAPTAWVLCCAVHMEVLGGNMPTVVPGILWAPPPDSVPLGCLQGWRWGAVPAALGRAAPEQLDVAATPRPFSLGDESTHVRQQREFLRLKVNGALIKGNSCSCSPHDK